MNDYYLTSQERITLNRASARAMMGKSVLHPQGRIPTPMAYRDTLVLDGQSTTYPRTATWVISEHRKIESS